MRTTRQYARGILVAAVCPVLAACSGHQSSDDALAETVDAEWDAFGDTIDGEWGDCPPHVDLNAHCSGPGDSDVAEILIDSEARITSMRSDNPRDVVLGVDFSEFSTELSRHGFTFPIWAAEEWNLTLGEVIHVDYQWYRAINPRIRIEISRDGAPIVLGYHYWSEDTFEFDGATFTIGTSDCEPFIDGCGARDRLFYDVDCPDLTSPVRVLDGTSVLVPCGPGYQVAIENLLQAIDELTCTDMPERQSVFLIVRSAE